ncbi:glycosyltransferase [Hydrogenophaga sp.]|jgi:glycosyltransferase involved in cell wall biosynthesis|uniref:glycosyltransferase n=1 Tax=Hydrogenophaga sp. TaxID=1904254 RepID=UPI0025BFE401|nr:glycosyltransferase [Hydrogenophaga sp.]MDO9131519.1 glycosyltransferase [Hydrogenophaga sp.]MDO9506636.1 glycosyltransferase [Hydrogenophaga sp.]MDP2985856.1 glycosyltransferase [Hydrogenophaga sp.]MDP3625990.1 glycosyltransferase [Hydrogenophaga sp.]
MISFIVPAYNEERLLGATLQAINAVVQALDEPCEVIVVDDGSTDRTAEIGREHGAQVVAVAHRQIAATRNAGARVAQGDVFIFVDADTLVHETLVRLALQALRDGAVGGGAVVRFDGAMPLHARLMVPLVVKLLQVSRLAAGCFFFCTRTAFEAVGGFDERYFAAEELGLSRALKRQGRFLVLREPVLSSGRKLRTHSAREMWALLGHLMRGGLGAVRQRKGLDLWYAQRREDPHNGV